MASIKEISGISDSAAERLREAGIRTCEQLLEVGATSSGRMHLADETHLDDVIIKRWVHQADLMRLPGLNGQIAELLCDIGVVTIPKLAYRNVDALYNDLIAGSKGLVGSIRLPLIEDMRHFSAVAKTMPKVVHH